MKFQKCLIYQNVALVIFAKISTSSNQDIKLSKFKPEKTKMSIHETIPIEILVKILRELDHESIKVASVVCKYWRQIIENFELNNPFIIVFGGVTCQDVPVDVISGGLRKPKIPKFSFQDQFDMIYDCTMINHFGTILVCGGKTISQECYQLKGKTWAKHSNLIKMRFLRASAITTKDTTYLDIRNPCGISVVPSLHSVEPFGKYS